jgi:N-acetylmuramoyl-L-alanine amidase
MRRFLRVLHVVVWVVTMGCLGAARATGAAKKSPALISTRPAPRPASPQRGHAPPSEAAAEPISRLLGRLDRKQPAAQLLRVQTWSNRTYSRVALYLSGPALARVGTLQEDVRAGMGPRIYVDIQGSSLAAGVKRHWPLHDDLVCGLRLADRPGGQVRVVLDLKKKAKPRLMVMENPYRLVIDALAGEAPAAQQRLTPVQPPALRTPGSPAVQPPASGRRACVVLDPGHGGHDSGALGPHGSQEKDVVLQVAHLAKKYLLDAGIDARLTRDSDTYVSLEGRTALANKLGALAFVSIHANSAPNKHARGIETYHLNVTDDRYAIRLAARENKTSIKQVSDLQMILADLSTKANSQESQNLAQITQTKLMQHIAPISPLCRNLGVKASLFYVLLGARMPAILVETSFISNAAEAKLLQSQPYQRHLAKALAEGIAAHLHVQAP